MCHVVLYNVCFHCLILGFFVVVMIPIIPTLRTIIIISINVLQQVLIYAKRCGLDTLYRHLVTSSIRQLVFSRNTWSVWSRDSEGGALYCRLPGCVLEQRNEVSRKLRHHRPVQPVS